MSLTIELSKNDEERLAAAARRKGVDASTLARKLLIDILPSLGDTIESIKQTAISSSDGGDQAPGRMYRKPGSAIGIITLSADIETPLDDFNEYM